MKYIKPLFYTISVAALVGLVTITGIYFYIKPELPSVDVLKDVRLQTPMRIYTSDGKLISQFGVKRRIPLTLDDVPEQLIQAVLATEDSRFYEHPGIDPIGIVRAAINLIITGEKQQGASTLTMQLARGFFLTRDKTYIRKIKEIFIAWHMEQLLSKREILELYLNKIELGHRAFGFGAAAQVYYGKDIKDLTLAQLATIAGLPKAPSTMNPISRPDRSIERRRVVLLRMLDEGYIDRAQFEQAANAPVTARKHGAEIELDAPYLADLIYNEMVELYGKEEAETGGYKVYATVPSHLQQAAQRAVVQNLHDYDERHGYRGPIRQLWQPIDYENLDEPDITEGPIDDPAWSEQQMLEALADVNAIDPLVPAIVTRVDHQNIEVFDASGQYIDIGWDGLMWARPYIADNRQGDDPKVAADVAQQGQLVWIRKRFDDGRWQLSQMPEVSGAFIALDPHNGAAQAVVGGYSFYESQFNRATQAKRQVGSNIKPFVYSSALENGYTIASIINDAPINQWDKSSGVAWRPQNSPAEYDGPIRMRVALGKSKNVVSVRLLRGVGLDNAIDHLTRFGFQRDEIPRDETVSLGSGSHTPLEVARAMAVIANGGFLVEPHFIQRIADDQDNTLWAANPPVACEDCELTAQVNQPVDDTDVESLLEAELSILTSEPMRKEPVIPAPRVISEQNAFLVAEMLRTAVRANGNWSKKTYWMGTGWRARNILEREDIAGKTGTTNDSRDTWFTGFTRDLVATSWVGFDDMNRQLGRTTRNQNLVNLNPEKFNWIGNALIGAEDGAKAAQPAWIRFMQVALEDVPESFMPIPDDIVTVRIDRNSGKLTRRTDHTAMFEYFMKGTEPQVYVLDEELVDPLESEDEDRPEPVEIF
ncbi:penicillin-binding protein 1A [Aestuariibacter salexigens]|uniref:penicillin-binding protein 1A n=1 Tax=Aestuariibacter salexigens TaxID=226010 RepID=UPI0003FC9C31|nr:penicillin-binding protein 1A [Aestuariibacter salexigens]